MRHAPQIAAAAAALCLLRTPAAAGQQGAVPVRVAYTAHDGCPDSGAFLSRVLERTSVARVAEPGEVARTLVVSIVRDGKASAGKISLVDRSGVTSSREVAAASCEQVVMALALVAAVSIDQDAASDEPAASDPSERVAPVPAETDAGTDKTDKPAPTQPSPQVDGARSTAEPEAEPSLEPAQPGIDWIAVGANVELTTGYDERTLAPGVFGQIGFGVGPLRDAAIRLSFLYASNSARVDVGQADFTWLVARLGLCPLSLGGEIARLRPCAGFEGGAVRSQSTYEPAGADPERMPSSMRAWAAGFGLLRGELRLSRSFWLEANGGLVFPFTRYSYAFVDGNERRLVREAPRVGGLVGVGLGVGLL